MTRLARILLKFIASAALFWLSLMLLLVMARLSLPLVKSPYAIVSIAVFAASAALFCRRKFTVLYVFGHEMTHFIVAKLFLKETGKLKIGRAGGFVEVKETNVWIALAPYIIPFYTFIAMGIYGLVQLFVSPMPWWGTLAFSCLASAGYAYHAVLNAFALHHSQSDLVMYGRIFSLSIIIAGNIAILLAAHLLATSQWKQALNMLCSMSRAQFNFIWNLL